MIILSINVYKNPPFLMNQLNNIATFVKSPYLVILNCNDTMFAELRNLPENVVKNPETINKQRFHGSLLHGIYSNMVYALHYTFDAFLILSSRTVFYRELRLSDLKFKVQAPATDLTTWHWPSFTQTLVAKRARALYSSPHEGLCFSRDVVASIHQFLSDSPQVTQDLITFPHAVEEFALQTIAEGRFLYLGNGCYDDVDYSDPHKYVRKIDDSVETPYVCQKRRIPFFLHR